MKYLNENASNFYCLQSLADAIKIMATQKNYLKTNL